MITRHRLAFVAVLAAYLGLGVLYATRTPLWQIPDEPAHFNYVAQVSDATIDPPEIEPGDYPFERLETLKAERFPPDEPITGIEYEDHQPPAYYYVASLAFRLAGADDGRRVRTIRLLGVLLGAITVWLAWRVARRTVPEDPLLALATAAFVGFLPMHLTMTAAVNNDPLADLVMGLLLLLGLHRATGRLPRRRFVLGGGLLFGLALLTKVTIYAPAAVLLIAAEGTANRRGSRSTLREGGATALATLGLGLFAALPWFARNAVRYGPGDALGLRAHDAVVHDQPRTTAFVSEHGLNLYLNRLVIFTFDSFWGVFGWMGEFLDRRIYLALALASAAAAVGILMYVARLVRRRDGATRERRVALALSGLVVAATSAGFLAYNVTFVQHQGRYFFPALIPIALFYLLGLREAARWSSAVIGRAFPRTGQQLRQGLELLALGGFSVGLAALALLSLYSYIIPHLSCC